MKKFWVALCVLALCLVACGALAEGECAHENYYTLCCWEDEQYHQPRCNDCGEWFGEKAAHIPSGDYAGCEGDFHVEICEVCSARCGDEEPCVYTGNVNQSYLEGEAGYHRERCDVCFALREGSDPIACTPGELYYAGDDVHYLRCTDCDGWIGTTAEPHVFDHYTEYGWEEDTHRAMCGICGYSYGAPIACTPGEGIASNYDGTHSAACVDCGAACGEAIACTPGSEYRSDWDNMGTHHPVCALCDGTCTESQACTPGGGYAAFMDEVGVHHEVCTVCNGFFPAEPCVAGDGMAYNYDGTHSVACALCSHSMGGEAIACTPGDGYYPDEDAHIPYCSECGGFLEEMAEPHVFGGYGSNYVDAGYHRAYCGVCWGYYGDLIPCTPGEQMAPNYDGTHSAACVDCGGAVEGEKFPCTADGETYYGAEDGHYPYCSVCEGEMPVEPHVFGGYDYYEDGTHVAYCSVCWCAYGEPIPHDEFTWFRANGMWCAYGCPTCGYSVDEKEHEWDPNGYKDLGDGVWHSAVCLNCGGEGQITHWCTEVTATSIGDPYIHSYSGICDYCGGTKTDTTYHYALTCDATECAGCGQKDALLFRDQIAHKVGEWKLDGANHYQECEECGQKVNVGPCEVYDCADGVCGICGMVNPNVEILHYNYSEFSNEEGHFWTCENCGYVEKLHGHFLSCENEDGDWCWYCGEEYPDLQPAHDFYTECDETGHWQQCWICGEKGEVEAHTNSCVDYGYCSVCYMELPEDIELEHYEKVWMNTGKQHWQMCSYCYEVLVPAEDHTPSAADEKVCAVCGGKIGDSHEHGWKTREIPATCTKDGFLVDNCPICGIEMGRIRVKATGHQLGEFVDNGDGTQTATCAVCGEAVTEEIPVAAPAAAAEGENVPANAELVVEEAVVEEAVLANVPGTVAKALNVKLLVDGAEAEVAGEITVKILLTAEEAAAMEGKVVMIIGEDNVPVEVEYEVVENELIIKTQVLGLVVIVEKAE